MSDLTICVPVYNVESYLEQCVESILRQSYRDIQVILIDDGSTDSSGMICDGFRRRDKRVKVIHKQNGGPITARYAGLKVASTKYVTFVDADDWLDVHMYECLMKLLKQTGCEVVVSGIKVYVSKRDIRSIHDRFKEGLYSAESVRSDIVPYMIWNKGKYVLNPSLATKIFLREKIIYQYDKLIREDFHYGEDMAIIYPLIMESQSVFITHKAYYYHRQRKENEVAGYITDDEFFEKLLWLYNYLINISKDHSFDSKLKQQLDLWYIESVSLKKRCYRYQELSIKWLFPFGQVGLGSRIILYGAGKVGQEFFSQIRKTKYCHVVAWVDRGVKNLCNNDCMVKHPECIEYENYDAIVIAISDWNVRKEIAEELKDKYDIKLQKIIWEWNDMP
jgi:glycosyltransferase involved in cell wall biosynthesis